MTGRGTLTAAACAGAALSFAGCGLRSLGTPVQFGQRRSVTQASARSGKTLAAVQAPGGRSVLLRFANAFANVSARSEASREHRLLALSTGALRRIVLRDGSQARLATVRGMPAGARMVGVADVEQLAATGTSFATGLVVVSERLMLADGASEMPLIEYYHATLDRTRRGWLVAVFSPGQ